FRQVTAYDEKGRQKYFQKPESLLWLQTALSALESTDAWCHDALKEAYEQAAAGTDIKIGMLVNTTRLALTGKTVGPGLYELTELLGRDEALARMKHALTFVESSGEFTT
ncbi:MAG TPA: glutamate--tRNA ligase, partial [Candidatus Hydrogenedentes bacterium]|nr:glutamate--tRNA ligase [Candidatus Hydrogenedentota bacterium]